MGLFCGYIKCVHSTLPDPTCGISLGIVSLLVHWIKMGYTGYNVKNVFGLVLDKLGITFVTNYYLGLLNGLWRRALRRA